MKKRILTLSIIFALAQLSFAGAKPKFGPKESPRAQPLSASNSYFRSSSSAAPDYWALSGYYVPQFNGAACSVASVTMILNAAMASMAKTADDKVVTQQALLDKVNAENWKDRITSKMGYHGEFGATLDVLGKVTEAAFKTYGFKNVSVKVVHVNDTSVKTREALVKALTENEKSNKDFILANFDQQAFTDDTQAGHISPVGAFDAKTGRVLILDPDREYYEPYWVSIDTFMSGMATEDKRAKAHRGYVIVQTGN